MLLAFVLLTLSMVGCEANNVNQTEADNGKKYENYFEEISEIITNSTILFIRNNNREDIEDFVLKDLVHILVSSYVKGILEPLVHEMSFKKAQIHIQYF